MFEEKCGCPLALPHGPGGDSQTSSVNHDRDSLFGWSLNSPVPAPQSHPGVILQSLSWKGEFLVYRVPEAPTRQLETPNTA